MPPKRPDISRTCLCALVVRAPCVSAACMFLLRARHAVRMFLLRARHAALTFLLRARHAARACPYDPSVGAHVSCLPCEPWCSTQLVCTRCTLGLACWESPPPCVHLQPTSVAMPSPKAWLYFGPCQLAHGPIRVYEGLTVCMPR
ncbi:hypothetical protein PanWU01x14_209460 [Parasponia andersonii]|uniref:Uncharacterized protein n=1 Tax=Parasponia andersonii TaxID=3476 RepID=A0A2P5BUG4_PARAD|nr:hypothetical protein PanWU01x14_209460 [Parasponia andersonii]